MKRCLDSAFRRPIVRMAAFLALLIIGPDLRAGQEVAGLETIGTSGKGERVLGGGREAVLYEHQGKGCLTHFWFGGNFKGVENTRIRYYVDGTEQPAIDMALYLGHGIGFGDNHAPWATKHVGKIGRGNGIYHNYRIPFGKSIRVTAQRAPDAEDNPQIWWIIRGVENLRISIGGVVLPESARLTLSKLENHVAAGLEEFDLFKAPGAGAVHQVTIAAESLDEPKRLTFLEACIRAYADGAKEPRLLSSGLEDYFLGTYYFDTGKYHADIAGLTHFDPRAGRFSAYRFHDEDPLFFKNGLRLTCRCGETEHGTLEGVAYCDPPRTRYTTYVWAYRW